MCFVDALAERSPEDATSPPCGAYGDGCALPCHCKGNDRCDPLTGACPRGCAPGLHDNDAMAWMGASCQIGCIVTLHNVNLVTIVECR